MLMYQEERLKKIMEWLHEEEVLSNSDLMERLGISRDTARRDIVQLTQSGKAVRTHGGIASMEFEIQVKDYVSRIDDNPEGKERIGREVVSHLRDKDVCFFDTSTHMQFVCRYLKQKVKVYTHSLDNLERLAKVPQAEVHCLGGKLNRENHFFYGMDVWNKISSMRFDVVVLGAAALHFDGIYFEDEEDAQIKSLAAQRADKVIVMADYKKFQRISRFKAIDLSKIDYLITDKKLSAEWETNLKKESVVWKIV